MLRLAVLLALALPAAAPGAPAALPDASDGSFHPTLEPWLAWTPPPPDALPSIEPVAGAPRISSGFGLRRDPLRGGEARHFGLDFAARLGSAVRATADGIVRRAGPAGSYGNLVEIVHDDGYVTRYAHLSRILVRAGMAVTQGEEVGLIGSTGRSTGAHLHYEVRLDGLSLDPRPFLYEAAPPARSAPPAGPVPRWDRWADLDAPDRLPSATIR